MQLVTASSNRLSSEMYKKTLLQTVRYITAVMKDIYGPAANEQIIEKDGKLTFTKDGKEILTSLFFDNAICNTIKVAIQDAANIQGEEKGDSSTTLIMFTTLLVEALLSRKAADKTFIIGDTALGMCDVLTFIDEHTKPLDTYNLDELKCLVHSITRDDEITEMVANIYHKLDTPPLISFEKDSTGSKMRLERENEPVIDVKVLYAPMFSLFTKFDFEASRIILLDGGFDFDDDKLFDIFLTSAGAPTIVLCNQITPTGSAALKRLEKRLTKKSFDDIAEVILSSKLTRTIEPFIILSLTNGLNFSEEFARSLSTLLYGSDNFKSIKGAHFESIMRSVIKQSGICKHAMGLLSLDFDKLVADSFDLSTDAKRYIDKMNSTSFMVNMNDGKLVIKYHELSPEAMEMKALLERQIQEVHYSVVAKAQAKQIYTALFGTMIKVFISADLVLERGTKYELTKDAILTVKNAMEHGVYEGSIVADLQVNIKDRILKHVFKQMVDILGPIDPDAKIIDSADSVKTALSNGFKTAVNLTTTNILVGNMYNIHNEVIGVQAKDN